jgi:DNA helicase IV
MLPQRLASAVLVKMELSGDAPDDRVQNSVARSKPVKQYAEALWPRVDSRRLVRRLLSDPVFLEEASAGLLSDSERVALGSPTPGGAGRPRATWSLHDAVLVDEARDLLERTPSLGHVVLDEAQDLSPMMLRSVGRYCSTGSATVLGDVAQATTPWGVTRWDQALAHLGKVDAHIEELTLGFRVPGDVIEYAARLLPIIAPGLTRPTSVRRAHGELKIVSSRRLLDAATEVVRKRLFEPGSIGLIVPDDLARVADTHLTRAQVDHSVLGRDDDMEARVDVVPATLAKGLEFDTVILVEPADIASAEADSLTGLRRLYVCLTRAVTSLVVVHAKPLPPPL